MLPYSDNAPFRYLQSFVRIAVAPSVRLDLLSPKSRIPLRLRSMLRASMPKAAIDKDRYSCPAEYQVSAAARLFQYNSVYPIS